MYFYDEPYAEPECACCNEKDKERENALEFMQGIIDQLYGKERFDEATLENCLDEAAHFFDLKLPKETLAVRPKRTSPEPLSSHILNRWKALNNQYLKSLTP